MRILSYIATLKVRIYISIAIGFLFLLTVNDFEIFKHPLIALLGSIMYIGFTLRKFLLFSGFVFTIITIPILIRHKFTEMLIYQFALSLIITIGMGTLEVNDILNKNLEEKSQNIELNEIELYAIYNKACKKGNINALCNLAQNPNTPDSIEIQLSNSDYLEVKQNVALYTESKDILLKLSKDPAWEVRSSVALNELTPSEILQTLQADSNEDVRNTAFSVYWDRIENQ